VYRAAVAARREWYLLAVCFITVAFAMAPLSAVCTVSLARALGEAGVPARAATAAGLLYALGTPVFFRTGYLNHNLIVAHCGLLGFLVLWNRGRGLLSASRTAAAGALGGYAVLCDYSGVVTLMALGVYAWMRGADAGTGRLRAAMLFGAGAAPALIGLLTYQRVAFGAGLRPAQHFMDPIAPTSQGYRGFDWPSLSLAWSNLVDPRFGLFVFCPLLLLALAAPLATRARFRVATREAALFAAFVGAFLMFCAANRYSVLQWNTGFRYLVPVVPPLFVLALQAIQTLPLWGRKAVAAGSILWAWVIAAFHAAPVAAWRALVDTGPDLPSMRWMSWLGLLETPRLASLVILAASAWLVARFWRKEASCAF
jgi:hypothetical protein